MATEKERDVLLRQLSLNAPQVCTSLMRARVEVIHSNDDDECRSVENAAFLFARRRPFIDHIRKSRRI